jgi:hypothetical protein
MLSAEEAKAALESVRNEDWRADARKRVRKLKRGLRPIAEAILTPGPERYTQEVLDERQAQMKAAAVQLDELEPDKRAQLMAALHPSLGPALAYWWVSAQAEPYGTGWNRRGFRAPNRPELSREKRVDDLARYVVGAGPYSEPPAWFAAWAPYFRDTDMSGFTPWQIGPLLAAAIDLGGEEGDATFQALVGSGNGEHAVGRMGEHVIVGLLRSSRPEAWEYIESMLLAAQRQEGLRQSILQAADEAHPQAFTRIIGLCVDKNLIRFAATIRSVGVWLGYPEDAGHIEDAENRLRMLQAFRSDPARARERD